MANFGACQADNYYIMDQNAEKIYKIVYYSKLNNLKLWSLDVLEDDAKERMKHELRQRL